MCFKKWMTFIRKSLKKFCNPRMTWTMWNSVSSNKSGPLINHYQTIIMIARKIMSGGHEWKWCYQDLTKLIYDCLSITQTWLWGLNESTNCYWFLIILGLQWDEWWFQNKFGKRIGTLKTGKESNYLRIKVIFNIFLIVYS